ncbi:MAG: transcription elongation factor GreA [Parachlamydiaceae bacterium]
MQKYPVTKDGASKIQNELEKLKSVDRPKVITAIADARALGDLKENAEYHAAREEQAFIEARIKDLEHKISIMQVIDVQSVAQNGRVVFGTTVLLEDVDSGNEVAYKIVGVDESDIKLGLLAYNTPIARALIGSEEGDVVDVEVPGGQKSYEILEVKYL